MMDRMWMGPRGGETWAPVEHIGGDRSRGGWQSGTGYVNGGYGSEQSVSSHMTYTMTFNKTTRDTMRPITDMRAGIRGPGPIYFIDPWQADKNVLSECWSFPAQACYDAIPLIGDDRPEKVTTANNDLEYPVESAKYDLTSTTKRSFYLPIPPGYSAWVGVHGDADDEDPLRVRPVTGGTTYGTGVFPTLLDVTSDYRVNTEFSSATCDAIELDLGGGDATTATLAGMIVQVLPTGTEPERGGFISGQGHSGCTFVGNPGVTAYSSVLPGEVGATVRLIEVGDWL